MCPKNIANIFIAVSELNIYFQNVTIAIVGKDHKFRPCTEAELESYLGLIEGEERRGGRREPPEEEEALPPAAEEAGAAEEPADGESMETGE